MDQDNACVRVDELLERGEIAGIDPDWAVVMRGGRAFAVGRVPPAILREIPRRDVELQLDLVPAASGEILWPTYQLEPATIVELENDPGLELWELGVDRSAGSKDSAFTYWLRQYGPEDWVTYASTIRGPGTLDVTGTWRRGELRGDGFTALSRREALARAVVHWNNARADDESIETFIDQAMVLGESEFMYWTAHAEENRIFFSWLTPLRAVDLATAMGLFAVRGATRDADRFPAHGDLPWEDADIRDTIAVADLVLEAAMQTLD